jgi:hypothetical protein
MVGRDGHSPVFDRGKYFMSFLWPPLLQFMFLGFPVEMLLLLIVFKVMRSVHSWWHHFLLADVIGSWMRAALAKKMKLAGIKPRRTPIPPPLIPLPSNLMVLSSIMILMSRVGLQPVVALSPPVTWVEAFGGVRSLHGSLPFTLPPPPKPPDPEPLAPFPSLFDPSPLDSAVVEEGNEIVSCGCCVPNLQCPDVSALDEVLECSFTCGLSASAASHLLLDPLADISQHVTCSWWFHLQCCLSQWPLSFGPLGLLAAEGPDVSAIVDTGASMCLTFDKADFISYQPLTGKVIKGLTKGVEVQGVGIVSWTVEVNGNPLNLKLRALHVPATDVRLLCPQQLRQEHPSHIEVIDVGKQSVSIVFPEGTLECPFNDSNLPVMRMTVPSESKECAKALNACVMAESNQNLTPSQKELLRWHSKLGHVDFRQVQRLMKTGALGHNPLIKAAQNLDLAKHPMVCGSCAYAKAKRKSHRPKTNKQISNVSPSPPVPEKLLSKDVLFPGKKVSMDHFIVSTPGRLFSSRGSESIDRMYKGGVIFKDHASGHVFIEPVVNFTAGEALRAKRTYEREMASMNVTVLHYHTDNGVFTAAEFQDELARSEQGLSLSGVGAHHQNAVAEREIGVVFNLARTMMLHAKLRWPQAVTAKLWPMVVKHTQHLVNHIPGHNNVCPMDLVLGSTVPRDHLRNLHVWGAPAYILHPKLQDGGKIPKWDPRSRQGLHLGWSPLHASTVPLILNLTTGNISPQFHVVFDDWFTTVSTEDKGIESIDDETWNQLFMDNKFMAHFDDNDPADLDSEWLTEIERIERHHKAVSRVKDAQIQHPKLPSDDPVGAKPEPQLNIPLDDKPPSASPLQRKLPSPSQRELPSSPPAAVSPLKEPAKQRESPELPKRRPKVEFVIDKVEHPVGKRARPAPGRFKGMCASMIALLGNNLMVSLAQATVNNPAAHVALLGFNAVTETFDDVDFYSYKALTTATFKSKSKKGQDPDLPTLFQAMSSPDADEWLEAMQFEIDTLTQMGTWTVVSRAEADKLGKKVVKLTWALRQKRDPAGNPTKKKARICVRGDILKLHEAIEAWSPVVQWSTVRLMLILSIVHKLETRQVDYVNAFAQADLDRDVFVEIPGGFSHNNEEDCVLKLNKSLYGMTDSPLMFFELLKKNLLDVGFKQFDHLDPCLFVHPKAICVTYVDDCLWFSKDGGALDKLIQQMKQKLNLKVESDDVSAFLGIQFTRHGDTIELKQVGLIDKIIEATGMQDCNTKPTPAADKTLGKDKDGKPFSENWGYATVVGMLLYLAGNSRPDIAFAVHQAARFTHAPMDSHATAVKRIVKYLKGTRDKGMIFRPTSDWKLDCLVDSDFCGLWGSEDPDDPIVSKSRTGFIITFAGCPLLWKSCLQQETSLSTMMAEYVALSASMRELLPLKRLVETIAKIVTGDPHIKVNTLSDVFEDNSGALAVATLPKITPQSKFFAVKLHFFKEHVKTPTNPNGTVNIQKIESEKNIADIFTKGLVEAKFVPLRDKLMGWDLLTSSSPKLSEIRANLHSRGSVEIVRADKQAGLLSCQFNSPKAQSQAHWESFQDQNKTTK